MFVHACLFAYTYVKKSQRQMAIDANRIIREIAPMQEKKKRFVSCVRSMQTSYDLYCTVTYVLLIPLFTIWNITDKNIKKDRVQKLHVLDLWGDQLGLVPTNTSDSIRIHLVPATCQFFCWRGNFEPNFGSSFMKMQSL